ncbi:MAG: hypothetical protein ACRDA4_07320 [Filifactoraceae bacterium]
MNRKKQLLILLMAVCFIGLSACSSNQKEQPSLPAKGLPTKQNLLTKEFRDEKGMVTVHVDKGVASLSMNIDKWPASLDIKNHVTPSDATKVNEMLFKIEGLRGNIKDVYVHTWADEDTSYDDYKMPAVVFLMEDGSLEWIKADLFFFDVEYLNHSGQTVSSLGKLPEIKNISSISVEKSSEGIGNQSVAIAKSAEGKSYNLEHALNAGEILVQSLNSFWEYKPNPNENYSIYIRLNADGTAVMRRGENFWNPSDSYKGVYQFNYEELEKNGIPSGGIGFDLTLDKKYSDSKSETPKQIKGGFSQEVGKYGKLSLWPSNGEQLYNVKGKSSEMYIFTYANLYEGIEQAQTADLSDDELIEYLYYATDDIGPRMYDEGWTPLVTGETTEIPNEGRCRNIWFGVKTDKDFEKKELYTVSSGGSVYMYNADDETWEPITPVG